MSNQKWPKDFARSVLTGLVQRQFLAISQRIFDGQLSAYAISKELYAACLRAGSAASHLLGPEALTELLLELCPPRAPTELESLARDISYVLVLRRDRLAIQDDPNIDVESELLRLFEVRPELCLQAAAYLQASPALDDFALAEPLCVALEHALRSHQSPTSH